MNNLYNTLRFLFLLPLLIGVSEFAYSQSVLSEGQWYKVAVENNGLYQLTYQDFEEMGFDMSSIAPQNIQVFGNIEGVLPEANNILVPNSLIENSIYVHGADDNSFDEGDYIVFYGQGSYEWKYERLLERFRYYSHPYDDLNYYFITIGNQIGKRIGEENSVDSPPFKIVTDFIDYQSHESNLKNFVKSGRKWFGESFEDTNTIELNFDFPNRDTEKKVRFGLYAAAYSPVVSQIFIQPNSEEIVELSIAKISSSYSYAKEDDIRAAFFSDEELLSFQFTYSKPSASTNAWIDYFEVNAYRKLKMHGHQMAFNYDVLLNVDKVFKFELENASENIDIWDISDPYNINKINGASLENNTMSYSQVLNYTHYYIAFDSEEFYKPTLIDAVENQNLKGLEPFEMVIITVDEFIEEAQRLADFHIEKDNLKVIVVTTDEIYYEFSSGKQDPSAIRNFLRYHYALNDEDTQLEYVLLFGDASYDYKDVLPDNTNLVPVFQSIGSISLTDTYNTDDFYGILGQLDGDSSLGEIQLSVGRFPVHTIEEAKIMVDKTIHYASNLEPQMGDWRNKVCFIADDEDSNLHFNDSNKLADTFLIEHPEFNVGKIFLDSYVQQSTANGHRYPDVSEAINKSVSEGVLFVNYTGHGGHIALTDERVMQIPDILSWRNYDNLSVFIVASCEFGPFDDPNHTSAGEHVVLNPLGGGVALFTTTRLAYASYNFKLNKRFHEIAFSRKEDGSHYRLGEIIKYAKNESGNKEKNLNFCLLGDPALKMAYPEYNVETTHINGNPVGSTQDTIKARQTITIKGHVTDLEHETMTNFQGNVEVSIYSKPSIYSTLANDPKSYKANFKITDNIIYSGHIKALDGEFEFSFIVPTGINSTYGIGKISYYATESIERNEYYDANGGFMDFIIGGEDLSVENDLAGPEINVYLEDYNFKSGDATTTDPLMIVDLFDQNGINNIQLGLGKDITARLDNDAILYLNNYYQAEDGSFQKGKVEYKLNEMDYGMHELRVKAWDMFDNLSEKSVSFIVIAPSSLDVYNVSNRPNPFTDFTQFTFDHNQIDESQLNVSIYLYDMQGKSIWEYSSDVIVVGNSIEPINWNLNDSNVDILRTGVYTYMMEIKNNQGQIVQQKQKLVVVK